MQAFVFSIAAEIERDMISRRTKEALDRKRREGVVLGRPIGALSKKKKLSEKESQVAAYLDKGLSYASIGRLMNIHRLTVAKFVEDAGLTKHRRNYLAYSEMKEQRREAKSLRVKNAEKQLERRLVDDEILRLYAESMMSITQLAAKLSLTPYKCRKLINDRGLLGKVKEINEMQRKKVKSSYQLARETGIPRNHDKQPKYIKTKN
jgi:DNA invertase Pin-like site-specific DNA recombinase